MSPDDLLWAAPQRGGLTSDAWEVVVDHLTLQLGVFLNREIIRGPDACITLGRSFGFSAEFWSPTPVAAPLDLQVRGTFGASNHDGKHAQYIGVQGWLYPYVAGHRTATTASGHNHIFLRYAKSDADDNDWEMLGCSGPSNGGYLVGHLILTTNSAVLILGTMFR